MLDIIAKYNAQQLEERRLHSEHDGKVKAAKDKVAAAQEKVRKAEKALAKVEKQREKLPWVGWKEGVVEPLAIILGEKTGLHPTVYGPFGLSSSTTIYLCEDKNKRLTEQRTLSICLVPVFEANGDLAMRYRTGETTDEYKSGTLGHLNGFNCVTAELPGSIEEIIKLLKESEAMA